MITDSDKIKDIYFDENIPVPKNFDQRFRSLIITRPSTHREVFLTMVMSDLLNGTIHNKDLFHKYDLELMNIRKAKK